MGVRDPAPGFLAIQIFVPSFYELPTALRLRPDNGRWDLLGGYAGVLTVFLSTAGLLVPPWRVRPPMRAPLIFFSAVTAWLLLKNFGVPPFDWIGYLPLFDQVWTPRWSGPDVVLCPGRRLGLWPSTIERDGGHSRTRARDWPSSRRAFSFGRGPRGRGLEALAPLQPRTGPSSGRSCRGLAAGVCGVAWPRLRSDAARECARGGASGIATDRAVVPRFPVDTTRLPGRETRSGGARSRGGRPGGSRTRMGAGGLAILAVAGALVLDPMRRPGCRIALDPAAAPPVSVSPRTGWTRPTHGDRSVLAPNYASALRALRRPARRCARR